MQYKRLRQTPAYRGGAALNTPLRQLLHLRAARADGDPGAPIATGNARLALVGKQGSGQGGRPGGANPRALRAPGGGYLQLISTES